MDPLSQRFENAPLLININTLWNILLVLFVIIFTIDFKNPHVWVQRPHTGVLLQYYIIFAEVFRVPTMSNRQITDDEPVVQNMSHHILV